MLSQVGVPAGVAYRQPVTEHASGAGATMMRRIKLKIVFEIFFCHFSCLNSHSQESIDWTCVETLCNELDMIILVRYYMF